MKGFDLMAVLLNPEFSGMIVRGMEMTLIIFAGSWLLAMSLGVILLAIRMLPGRIADALVAGYVSYHRNVPTLVQLMLWYFGISSLLPDGLQLWLADRNGEALFAIIALGLCQAAYFSEDLRSGLRAVPKGQWEAARALGHSYVSAMTYILLPQAVRNAMPALVNHTVSLFKNSSLAMAIGVAELTHSVKEVENQSFRAFETYLIATVLYLVCSLLLMWVGYHLERRSRAAGAI
ncbi:amino acid ABC transporter permease [Bradyrhizobium sp.]|jgi:polar amino acid transport system permease protein|uniref:amino acid ABC transporter permease n=1 Tax=Bradyrhizobium sp. TaxID=376 RepID=UPI002BC4CC05|nr:amino acid ABC transporter permease [Bradyrhizobium sp.]HWX57140.1 amino acid ABC transporter permease [Bradyrhizobium sp.]